MALAPGVQVQVPAEFVEDASARAGGVRVLSEPDGGLIQFWIGSVAADPKLTAAILPASSGPLPRKRAAQLGEMLRERLAQAVGDQPIDFEVEALEFDAARETFSFGARADFVEHTPGAPLVAQLVLRNTGIVSKQGVMFITVVGAVDREPDVKELASLVWNTLEITPDAVLQYTMWDRWCDAFSIFPEEGVRMQPAELNKYTSERFKTLSNALWSSFLVTVVFITTLSTVLGWLKLRNAGAKVLFVVGLVALVAFKAVERGALASSSLVAITGYASTGLLYAFYRWIQRPPRIEPSRAQSVT